MCLCVRRAVRVACDRILVRIWLSEKEAPGTARIAVSQAHSGPARADGRSHAVSPTRASALITQTDRQIYPRARRVVKRASAATHTRSVLREAGRTRGQALFSQSPPSLACPRAAAVGPARVHTFVLKMASTPLRPPVYSLDAIGCLDALHQIRAHNGGTLYVPPGRWECPSLNLSSHTTLFLAANATLKATPSDDKWPLVAPLSIYGIGHDHPGPRYAPFIGGWDVVDVVIGGANGTIDGSGEFWWAIADEGRELYTRPSLFECVRCRDIVMQDVTFANSGFWTVHPVLSKGVTARRITILNPHPSPNTDGFDPDATSDVLLADSYI